MNLSNVEDLKAALRLSGLKPHKSLGQHFLVDEPTMRQIIEAADISVTDTVLEIGPGLGVMTEELANCAAQVVAVETDASLAELLRRRLPNNTNIIEQDILRFDLSGLPAGYKVVANVPYYITSPILRLLMESPTPPATSVLLIQKEVAERLVAEPGNLSILALSVQYYAEVTMVATVPRNKFWPAPKVDSAVVCLQRRPQPAFPADPQKLFRLIKAGFGEKRKQLRNSLAGGLHISPDEVSNLLQEADLQSTARAQELSLGDWQRLYNICLDKGLLS